MNNKNRKITKFGYIGLAIGTLAAFTSCKSSIELSNGAYYYGNIWRDGPYCYNPWDIGCNYGYYDGSRIGIIFDRRHHHGHHDGHHNGHHGGHNHGHHHGHSYHFLDTQTLADRTDGLESWKNEFNLSQNSAEKIQAAFENAIRGSTRESSEIGLNQSDLNALMKFNLPPEKSIFRVAQALDQDQQDIKDFLEVFLIRMKTALNNK